nr:unnamed protein product [Callosobruchus chinensis]
MSWTREQVTVLLEEYRKWPNLYKIKSVNYKNRNKLRKALEAIYNALKNLKGDVTIGDIQSKFQALKQNAQRERRKCLESHRSGAGTDEIVEPSLWYFKLIEFIFDEDQPQPAVDSLSLHENEEEMNDVERNTATVSQEGLLIVDEVIQTPGSSASEEPEVGATTPSSAVAGPSWFGQNVETPSVLGQESGPRRKRRKMTPKATDEDVPPSSSLSAHGLSEASKNFADYVAAKLERITDEEVRDEAEEEIVQCLNRALKKCRKLHKQT